MVSVPAPHSYLPARGVSAGANLISLSERPQALRFGRNITMQRMKTSRIPWSGQRVRDSILANAARSTWYVSLFWKEMPAWTVGSSLSRCQCNLLILSFHKHEEAYLPIWESTGLPLLTDLGFPNLTIYNFLLSYVLLSLFI